MTTLWEIEGDLVSSHQPSGRVVTLPNSTVLSAEVFNYSWDEFPYVWNEVTIQLSYETDLEFARAELIDVADDFLGDEMARNVARYRELLSETPVELQLRYLVHPRRGQKVKNETYEWILARFNDHLDRVSFPVSRNR